MKTTVAERKWNNRVNRELNTWSYIHEEKPNGILRGESDAVPVTPIIELDEMPNEKCRDSILNVVNNIKIGPDDIIRYVEAAVTKGKVVAVRVFITRCNNQGAICGGGNSYGIWNEELFNNFWFDKVYRKKF